MGKDIHGMTAAEIRTLDRLVYKRIMTTWPRFEETGSPVLPGQQAYGLDGPHVVSSVEVDRHGGWRLYGRKEPHRDADGNMVAERFVIAEGGDGGYAHCTFEYARDYQEGAGDGR